MYRLLGLVLTVAMALPAPTLLAAGAGGSTVAGATGQISGRAFELMGRQLGPATVRLRSLGTFDGALAGTTLSGAVGDFSFSGRLGAGNYVVEVGSAAEIGKTAVAGAESAAARQAGSGAAAGGFSTSVLGIVIGAAIITAVALLAYEVAK